MKIELNSPQEAVEFFDRLCAELETTGGRELVGGTVKLDSVPSMPGSIHKFDGSTVTVWYRVCAKPSARQIREATVAVQMLGMPQERHTGKLVDVKRAKDGSVFFLCGGVLERRDEANDGMPAFRAFNPSKGQVLGMTVNCEAAISTSTNGSVHIPAPTPRHHYGAGVTL